MKKQLLGIAGISMLALSIAGCGGLVQSNPSAPNQGNSEIQAAQSEAVVAAETQPVSPEEIEVVPAEETTATIETKLEREAATVASEAVVDFELPQPENILTEGEYRWSQLLPRDGIRPIYEEEVEFVDAANAPYDDNELVIGVEINGEARAYAIGPLNSREMVNDTVGGVPILVTW